MRALAIILFLVSTAHAADPAVAINKAKVEITAGNPAAGLRLLREVTAGAASMTDLEKRSGALSAIHFYSALALSKLRDDIQAAAELRSFFLYRPGAKLDTSEYPREFAELFSKIQRDIEQGRTRILRRRLSRISAGRVEQRLAPPRLGRLQRVRHPRHRR